MNAPAISAQSLSKDFFDSGGNVVHACQQLNFEAYPGEVFGILGTNGAGKTTALRMLSTVLRPTSGDAILAGHSVAREPALVRESIGFLSSDTGVYGRLTPREMLEYFGKLHSLAAPTIAQRMDEIVQVLDMSTFLDRRCDKLSTGQKQRVNIARTILHDPQVLIFDEPTAGLDILASSQIVKFVRESRSRGKCVVLSTHIMREAEKLCDRLIIIHEGRVRAEGTPEGLRATFKRDELEDIFLEAIGHPVS